MRKQNIRSSQYPKSGKRHVVFPASSRHILNCTFLLYFIVFTPFFCPPFVFLLATTDSSCGRMSIRNPPSSKQEYMSIITRISSTQCEVGLLILAILTHGGIYPLRSSHAVFPGHMSGIKPRGWHISGL